VFSGPGSPEKGMPKDRARSGSAISEFAELRLHRSIGKPATNRSIHLLVGLDIVRPALCKNVLRRGYQMRWSRHLCVA